RGLSEGSGKHNFSLKSKDPLPTHFARNVQKAIDKYTCESVSSFSSSGSPTPTEAHSSWSGSATQSSTSTTGVSTKRSSICYWRDEEIQDRCSQSELKWKIWLLSVVETVNFDLIFVIFRSGVWSQRDSYGFHLKVLGRQVILPTDEGVCHFQGSKPRSAGHESSLDAREHSSNIRQSVTTNVCVIPISRESGCTEGKGDGPVLALNAYLVLKQKLHILYTKNFPLIRMDFVLSDDEHLEQKSAHHCGMWHKQGLPPIPPHDCIKDAAAEVFDHIWTNVVEILEELIRKWEITLTGRRKEKEKLKVAEAKSPQGLISRINTDLMRVPPSRSFETQSISLASDLNPPRNHRFSNNFYSDLNGVMTIQAKPLQQRPTHFADRTQNEQEDKSLSVGASSLSAARHRLGRISDTPAKKTPVHMRLPSLTSDSQRMKTPNVDSEEVLRGTRLQTGMDHMSSPPVHTARSRLPPIGPEPAEQKVAVPGSRPVSYRGRHAQNHVLSAIPDSVERSPLRERSLTVEQFSRPSTTHTFWQSDTPRKGSLTLMEFAGHTWAGQGLLTGLQYPPKSFQRTTPTLRKRFQVAS
uniref:DUF3719 domain-containing protein n=1 Tax=Myotis lucifugus TaxID=59463 RepID=G1Q5S6_MYOLU